MLSAIERERGQRQLKLQLPRTPKVEKQIFLDRGARKLVAAMNERVLEQIPFWLSRGCETVTINERSTPIRYAVFQKS
jgi:hypothetical protein